MKFNKILTVFLFTLFFAGNLFGKGSVLLTVDNNQLAVGQATTLKITVSNLKVSDTPKIANIDFFKLEFVGTSSNISIINGNFKSEKVFTYMITPEKKGTFNIGPALIKSNGKIYKSNIVTLKITNMVNKPKTSQSDKLFIEVSANKNSVTLNEEIILTIKIYRKIDVYNMSIQVPQLSNFIVTQLTDSAEHVDIRDGIKYLVTELKYSLFPTSIGKFVIPPFVLYCTVPLSNNPIDSFFKNPFIVNNTKKISVPSNSLKINVLPLKQPVYAVGDYNFTFAADKSNVKVGESFTLTFKISGYGNLNLSNNLVLPKIEAFKYYPDKPSVTMKKTVNGIYSEKVEKIAVVPEKNGNYKIPSFPIILYNPKSKKYEKFMLPAIPVKVIANINDKIKVVEAKNKNIIKQRENNIDTIITDIKLVNQDIEINIYNTLFLFVFSILILIIIYFAKYYYLSKKANFRKILQANAFNSLKKEIKQVSNIDELSTTLKKYFANRTGNINKAITFKEIISLMEGYNVDKKDIDALSDIFSDIEKAQFAGLGSNVNLKKLKDNSLKLIINIDKLIK